MSSDDDIIGRFAERFTRWSVWVMLALALVAVAVYAIAFWSYEFAESPSAFGQFGDYIAGVLNPAVAFCALLALVWSVSIQKKELRATKAALEKQNEITERQIEVRTFLDLLSMKDAHVRSLEFHELDGRIHLVRVGASEHFMGLRGLRYLAKQSFGDEPTESLAWHRASLDDNMELLAPYLNTCTALMNLLARLANHVDARRCAKIFSAHLTPFEMRILMTWWSEDDFSDVARSAIALGLFGQYWPDNLSDAFFTKWGASGAGEQGLTSC